MRRFLASLSLITWIVLPFAIGAFAGSLALDRMEAGATANGLHATGKVIEAVQQRARGSGKDGVMEYFLRFTYTPRGGEPLTLSKRVSEGFQKRHKVGDDIHLRYLPDKPEVVEVEFADFAEGASALRAFGWLFLLIMLIDAGRVWLKIRRSENARA